MKKHFLFFLVLTFFSINSQAKFDIQEGLWEYKNNVQLNGQKLDIQKKMQQAMAMLSEEQKAQMKMAMKNLSQDKQQAIQDFSKGESPKICLTKKMINGGHLSPENNKDCKMKILKDNGKVFSAKYTCKNKGNGSFIFTKRTKTNFYGSLTNKDNSGNTVKVQIEAKRLKSCKKG